MKTINGTFVAVKFREDIVDALIQYANENGVPNPIFRNDIHSTVVYSRRKLLIETKRDLETNWVGFPIGFDVFKSTSNGASTNCLVLKFHCEDLFDRHYELRRAGATHDYPDYNQHITLSYDIGDFDISRLPLIDTVLPELVIVQEYSEALKDEERRKEDRQEES